MMAQNHNLNDTLIETKLGELWEKYDHVIPSKETMKEIDSILWEISMIISSTVLNCIDQKLISKRESKKCQKGIAQNLLYLSRNAFNLGLDYKINNPGANLETDLLPYEVRELITFTPKPLLLFVSHFIALNISHTGETFKDLFNNKIEEISQKFLQAAIDCFKVGFHYQYSSQINK